MRRTVSLSLLVFCSLASAQSIDWPKVNAELLRHYQALVRIDTTDPPGNETKAIEYIQQVLQAEGIPVIVTAKDPARCLIQVLLVPELCTCRDVLGKSGSGQTLPCPEAPQDRIDVDRARRLQTHIGSMTAKRVFLSLAHHLCPYRI